MQAEAEHQGPCLASVQRGSPWGPAGNREMRRQRVTKEKELMKNRGIAASNTDFRTPSVECSRGMNQCRDLNQVILC